MTKARDLQRHRLHLWCTCGHKGSVSLREAAETSPEVTVEELARNAVCRRCGRRGAAEYRIVYHIEN